METLILFACGFLGVFLQCCIKANSLIVDAGKLNTKFTIKDYLSKDFLAITMSIAMIFVWFLLFGEVGTKYPKILDYIRGSFFGMGLTGSYLIQAIFNRSKSYIRKVMDEKSNISDGKIQAFSDNLPLTNPEDEYGEFIGKRPNDR